MVYSTDYQCAGLLYIVQRLLYIVQKVAGVFKWATCIRKDGKLVLERHTLL
jgi:hypothetical protein